MKPSPPFYSIANVSRIQWKWSVFTTSRSRNGTPRKLRVMCPAGECRAVLLLLLPRIYHHIRCKSFSLLIQPTMTVSVLIDIAVMYSVEWQTRQRCQMAMSTFSQCHHSSGFGLLMTTASVLNTNVYDLRIIP